MTAGKHDWDSIIPLFGEMTAAEVGRKTSIDHRIVSNYVRNNGYRIITKKDRYNKLFATGKSDKEIANILGVRHGTVTTYRIRSGISPQRVSEEAELQKAFVKTLDVYYDEYVRTDAGIADVVTGWTIYELKCKLTLNTLHTAIGQLLSYSHALPGRDKVIVCKSVAKPIIYKLAKKLDISILVFQ